jgi:hypothetical protein
MSKSYRLFGFAINYPDGSLLTGNKIHCQQQHHQTYQSEKQTFKHVM